MPAAPRFNKQATKVAYSIIGKPANIKFKPNKWQQYVNRMLVGQETYRVK